MRIAYVCSDQGIPVFGRKGCSVHVQEVIRALVHLGAEVDLFTPRGEGVRPPGLESVRLHPLPLADQKSPAAREQVSLRGNADLRSALAREGPFDLIYERYSLWSHEGMDYAQALRIPGLLEVNAPLIEEQAFHRVLVDRPRAEWVAHRVFGNATVLIAVSREVAAYLKRYPEAECRTRVIPNGVDPERFAIHSPVLSRPTAGAFTVGFVGTLKPWHGVSNLVDAFQQLHRLDSTARLLIVGDGPERGPIIKDVEQRGLGGAAHCTGAVDPDEIPALIAAMDVAVAPYPRLDRFYFSPLKVFEYMAAGRAVVASRIGQIAELIEHEVNGLLCNPGDAQDLGRALIRLHTDRELRSRLGQEAQNRIRRDYTWEATARRILDLATTSASSPSLLRPVGAGR
jgi:glycosyltransferase involved in cell wall biosynthesis